MRLSSEFPAHLECIFTSALKQSYLFRILSLGIAQFDGLFNLQHHITVKRQHFLVKLFIIHMSEPFTFQLLQTHHRTLYLCLLLYYEFLLNWISFISKVNLPSSLSQIHLAQSLLSQRLDYTEFTSMRLESAASPPLRSSTISVMESSFPLLILKLQNLMVCSI